jgi:hypothetical protein
MTKAKSAKASAGGDPETSRHVEALDWSSISSELDDRGCAVIGPLLTPERCEALSGSYDSEGIFRNRVVMERHGYFYSRRNLTPRCLALQVLECDFRATSFRRT